MLLGRLPQRIPPGVEQQDPRPLVVVGMPGDGRFGRPRWGTSLVWVVPFTSAKGLPFAAQAPQLYPLFRKGQGGLTVDSIALLDQLGAYDLRRGARLLGHLAPKELESLRMTLKLVMS